ncbi:MAG: DUF5694 domain-containing protein [Gammaproteobacteria bacterium]
MKHSIATLILLFASAAFATSPAIDFSGVQENLSGEPTQVLTLGTVHIAGQDEDTLPTEHLSMLLDKLEAFAPDVIAIESMPGESCDLLMRYASVYPDVWNTYCFDPQPALTSLNLSPSQAASELWAQLRDKAEPWTPAQRRHLAALFYAAGNPYSAALHWRQLDKDERKTDNHINDALLEAIEKRLASRNEVNVIAAALAARLNHDQLWPMDDHTADRIIARAQTNPYPVLSEEVWSKMPTENREHYEEGLAMFGSPDGVLRAYRHLNTPRSQQLTIDGDFGAAAAHNATTRQYVAWWQARGLRMAANVIEAAGNQPGAKVLVLVGASHKAYFDAYLDQMHDIKIVDVESVLGDD